MVGAQPSFSLINVLSELRPRTPSGPGIWWIGRLWSSKLKTISAISFMLTISSLPMFTGSRKSDFVNLKSMTNITNSCETSSKQEVHLLIIYIIGLFSPYMRSASNCMTISYKNVRINEVSSMMYINIKLRMYQEGSNDLNET